MSLEKLLPGDRCIMEKPAPLPDKPDRVIRYRYTVADSLQFPKRRNEALMIPVFRPINRKAIQCRADHTDPDTAKAPRVRWIERSKLRKLPA